MYGLIGKITTAPGQRDALAVILLGGTGAMPGSLSYIVATDPSDPDALWITEVWDTQAQHQASLGLPAVQAAIAKVASADAVARLWARDASLWTGGDEGRWLGWLDAVDEGLARLPAYEALSAEVRGEGFTHALLLGMGGSSLGPEVLRRTFGVRPGYPNLVVLDSTDPAQVLACERDLDLARTLVLVASKSGTTLEPDLFLRYFFDRVWKVVGERTAGSRFIASTDPGSKLEHTARELGFRRIEHGTPEIGGRSSVLCGGRSDCVMPCSSLASRTVPLRASTSWAARPRR